AAAPSAVPVTASAGAPAGVDAAQVHVCVDARGSLTAAPTLTHSSGDAGFDQAALQVARSGSGSYRAAGSPPAPCLQLTLRPEAP
ncbi:MAG TPA: TonB family protein, partial [Steroidobacteraceae bacterium]|nr:TonB family protein [Steroidobacteraceae bacterium]